MLRPFRTIRSMRVLLALLLCTILAGPAFAQHVKKKTYKQQIEQMESQWLQAQRTNDSAAIDRLLSDDYIGINAQGMVSTKAQTVERIQSRQIAINKLEAHDQKISIHGNTAIVTSEVEYDATNSTTQPPTHVHSKLRYTRVYLLYPSGNWRIVNFEATHISDMPGGALVPPADAPASTPAPAPVTTKP